MNAHGIPHFISCQTSHYTRTSKAWSALILGVFLVHCGPLPPSTIDQHLVAMYDKKDLHDRILGGLLGTSIGDAMGAPTEMWSREAIQAEYGHISTLTDMVREPSGEGTWGWNLPAGGSTDDTRWKKLLIDVLTQPEDPDPARALALSIIQEHDLALSLLGKQQSSQVEPYEGLLRQAHWLSEWVKVARPFVAGDHAKYQEALHRFYGGEMVCAGMIYAPAVGLRYPGQPARAYEVAYQMDIYDLGYARDMTGLIAAMVSAACAPQASRDTILGVIRTVDPKGYFQSRLVGRTAYKAYQRALRIVQQARSVDAEAYLAGKDRLPLALPMSSPAERQRYAAWATAYGSLDQELRRMPFHPDEIWLVVLTGMMMGEFEYLSTMEFIVNFGRDNDTSAAMAGAILGALHGAEALPDSLKAPVLQTSAELELHLPALSDQLIQAIFSGQ